MNITETTTRDDITAHLDEADVDYTLEPIHTGAGPRYHGDDMDHGAIRISSLLVYWDAEDPSSQGWAWRDRDCSGALDSFEELDELAGNTA
jgi:hypothetical protein